MQNYDEIVLFWLQPSNASEENLREVREIINDTRVFNDRDQCIETLPSIVDQTIFFVLGSGQSDLLDILSTFTYLDYIYLTEPTHFPYTSQVRGVFSEMKQLIYQLKKDIKTVHNSYTHLHLTKSGDLKQPHTTTQDLQYRTVEFKWIQAIFDVLLQTARPTENIHKDLLDECRLIYRGNTAQTRFIDEFEEKYEPSKAIWWYTRDTFLYRLINMALRTENMVIIWKFRFIIQDMYQQLKSMHEKQRNEAIENQQQRPLTVYRGQLIPSIELESLKNAEGGLIAMTSFVSTTRDHEVATIFAGNGAKPPNFEPVIFEIYIEQSDLEQERRPFADISEVSSKGKDEDEILLCMGTVMRIESVELSEEMSRIRLRTCPYNDSAWQYSKMGLLPCESSNSLDETYSLMTLGMLLFSMDECKKAEQFYSMINSSSDPVIKKMCQFYLIATRARQTKMFDLDYSSNMMMGICEMQKVIQSMANCESILDFCPEICKLQMQDIATFFELIKLKGAHSVNSFKLIEKYNELLEIMLRFGPMLDSPIFHSSLIEPVRLFSENTESNDEKIKSIRYDRMKSNMDKILSENDSSRSDIFYRMALSAVKEGNYDRAIAFVRDGLSITSNYNNGIDVELYNLLVIIYKKQKKWSAVIESCQSIIDMPQIPPSSSAIVKAHIERGDACIELDDLSEAFLSYTNALELQKQHHAPNHPLTSEIHINIGNVFEKKGNVSAALESYNEAITLGSPDTASTAYKNIGVMYMRRGNHDLARSNFIKCLEIQEGSIPHKTFLIACIHLWLARLEHKTERYEQRDFHIQQSRKIADHDEENHKWITEQISRILG